MASHHRNGGQSGSPAAVLGEEVDSDAVTDTEEHHAAGRAKDKGKTVLLPIIVAAGEDEEEEEGGPSGGPVHAPDVPVPPDELAVDESLSRLNLDDSAATPSSPSSPSSPAPPVTTATLTFSASSAPPPPIPADVVPSLPPAPASTDPSSPRTMASLPRTMPQEEEPQPPLPPLPTLPPLQPHPAPAAAANSNASMETRRRVRPHSPPLPLLPPSPQVQTLVPGPGPGPGPRPRAVSEWTPSFRQEQTAVMAPLRSMLSDVSLPRWQPDAEVTYCPICRAQFSIFVRKHHCRKCGRVVCNSCSPHRITIPYQYIVHPPGQYPFGTQTAAAALLGDSGAGAGFGNFLVDVSSLGGGERVRLCNPCVPDPNTAPPQTPSLSDLASASAGQGPQTRSHYRSVSTSSGPGGSGSGSRTGNGNGGGRLPPSSVLGPNTFLAPPLASSSSLAPQYQQQHYHRLSLPPQSFAPGASSDSHMQFLAQQAQQQQAQQAQQQQQRRSQRSGRHQQQQQQQQQRSQPLAEEDECPVCHLELPSRQLPNFEELREQHIIDCLETHSGGHRGRRRTVSSSGSGSGSGSTFGPLVGASNNNSNSSSSSSSSSSGPGGGYSQSQPSQLPPHQTLPWRTGMFPYQATEKDCVDAAECTICLEEFEVGVPMARLECFCRFHQACIQAWFEKHPGRCPVHNHDSSDY